MNNENSNLTTGLKFEQAAKSLGEEIDTSVDNHFTIPVIEEQVNIGKKIVETGRVKISKSVSETEETINIPLVHEEVQVERVPINQYIETAPSPVRYEGDTLIVPIVREVVVKRLLLVEELHVTKKIINTEETQQILLRTEEVNIERINNNL